MYNFKAKPKENQSPYVFMVNQLSEELGKHNSVEEAKKVAVALIDDYLSKYPKEQVIDALSEVLAIQTVRLNFFVLKEEVSNVQASI